MRRYDHEIGRWEVTPCITASHGVSVEACVCIQLPANPKRPEYQMRRVLKNTLILLPAAILAACASPMAPEQVEAKITRDYINPLTDYTNPLTDYTNPLTRGDTTNNNGGNGGN
jgi:hypothetical protein